MPAALHAPRAPPDRGRMGGGRGHLPRRTRPRALRTSSRSARPPMSTPPPARPRRRSGPTAIPSREERAAFLERIADEIEARGRASPTIGSQETGLPPARLEGERGRTTGQLRLFASHIRKGDYLDRRHDAALPDRQPLPRAGPEDDPAPDRPGRGLRRVELPARLLDRRGRHGLGAGRRLPGGGQGPLRPSRHRRDRGAGDRSPRSGACGMHPGVFSLIQGGRARRGRGAGPASADPGRGLHRLAGRGPGAVRPLRRAARADPVLRRAWARSTRCSCCPPPWPRAATQSRTGWAGSLTHGRGPVLHQSRHRRA